MGLVGCRGSRTSDLKEPTLQDLPWDDRLDGHWTYGGTVYRVANQVYSTAGSVPYTLSPNAQVLTLVSPEGPEVYFRDVAGSSGLVGAWARTEVDAGAEYERVLTLSTDGTFVETLHVDGHERSPTTGTWSAADGEFRTWTHTAALEIVGPGVLRMVLPEAGVRELGYTVEEGTWNMTVGSATHSLSSTTDPWI